MRWAQRQRLDFIGQRLLSDGAVNRRDLIGKFGISPPQAAVDFRCFEKAHPGAMRYDSSRKAYVAHNLTRPADDPKPDKIMTTQEYIDSQLKGWHSVCWNVDGFGNVGVRYNGRES